MVMKIKRLPYLILLSAVISLSSCGAADNRTADITAAGEAFAAEDYAPVGDSASGAFEGGAKAEEYAPSVDEYYAAEGETGKAGSSATAACSAHRQCPGHHEAGAGAAQQGNHFNC